MELAGFVSGTPYSKLEVHCLSPSQFMKMTQGLTMEITASHVSEERIEACIILPDDINQNTLAWLRLINSLINTKTDQ